jgi:hypothetical protein
MSCSAPQDNRKTYNQKYQVGTIPGMDSFNIYTAMEKSLDSIQVTYKQDSFRNNRGRIITNTYTNNELVKNESYKYGSVAMPCDCVVEKDTVFVNMAIGLFGGLGYDIKIYKDSFQSSFFEYTDDVKPYKSNSSDTAFTDFVAAKSKYQYLILDKNPAFQQGQQLTGMLTLTSNNYYNLVADKLNSTFVTGKLYFSCITKKK